MGNRAESGDYPWFDKVVEGGYCIGCGVCTAVAESPAIMHLDRDGRYQAQLVREITEAENYRLMAVCPFSGVGPDETLIGKELYGQSEQVDSYLGYYLACYAGHVTEGNYRDNGSSGGMGTWIAQELFSQGLVDKVIHVHESPGNGILFRYSVSESLEQIRNSAKSRYYPVEMSKVLQLIKEQPGRYAIVGVPCFIKAIRLLGQSEPIYRERISYCIGLVCGHLKSKFFTDLIAMEMGFGEHRVTSINFRKKLQDRQADDYGVEVVGEDEHGQERRVVKPTKELFGTNWGHGFFKYPACDYCDDVLAETADITVGDAWLPEYVEDGRGTNVIIVRNRTIQTLMHNAIREGRLHMDSISHNKVYQSQAGGFRHRRDGLAYRLFLKDQKEEWRPAKRVQASDRFPTDRKGIYKLRMDLVKHSFVAFRKAKELQDVEVFKQEMKPLLERYNKANKRPLWRRVLSKGQRIARSWVTAGR